jgi:hypothetical protein
VEIPPPSLPGLEQDVFLTRFSQIDHGLQLDAFVAPLHRNRFGNISRRAFINYRSGRNTSDLGLSVLAMPFPALAVRAVFGEQLGIVMKRTKVIGVLVDDQNDFPAIAAITAIGATPGHKFFLSKTHHAMPSVTGAAMDPDVIDKRFISLH